MNIPACVCHQTRPRSCGCTFIHHPLPLYSFPFNLSLRQSGRMTTWFTCCLIVAMALVIQIVGPWHDRLNLNEIATFPTIAVSHPVTGSSSMDVLLTTNRAPKTGKRPFQFGLESWNFGKLIPVNKPSLFDDLEAVQTGNL